MKRTILIALLAAALKLSAQENIGGTPFSFDHPFNRGFVPTVTAAPFDQQVVDAEDHTRELLGEVPLYGRMQAVDRGLDNAGSWFELPGGDRFWLLRVESPGALATELYFEGLDIPEGARLFVHSDDRSVVHGAFTSYNNHPSGLFATAQIAGDAQVIEYFEPVQARGLGRFNVSSVGHAYRFMGGAKADACEVDMVCTPESIGWGPEGDGVVRISVVLGGGGLAWCSGSLVNNTALDCKPYILTAFHCGESSTDANFSLYKFYFRYQRSGCGTGTALANKVMTGCTRRADSNCGGGDNGSDFLLVEANNNVPANFFPYFNGWDASGTGSGSGVGIHHPDGDEKKISTYTSSLASATWMNAGGAHWRVFWTATTNGWGVTEPGSSGSPLFNTDGRIVGTLTGGGSCCTVGGCGSGTGPTVQDLYGKMSYHWGSQNPNPANEELQVWLDPTNSGVSVLDGTNNPCGIYSVGQQEAVPPGIFPNPTADAVTVVLPMGGPIAEWLTIRDMSGRSVLTLAVDMLEQTIDISGLACGSYLLTVGSKEGTYAAAKLQVLR